MFVIFVTFSPDALDSIAAFLSGFGSVITAYLGVRWERKRSRAECEDRIKAFQDGLHLGESIEERK
jgi:hypothetical protein